MPQRLPFGHPPGAAGSGCWGSLAPSGQQGMVSDCCWGALNCLWQPWWGNAGMRRRGNRGLLYWGNKKHPLRVSGFSVCRLSKLDWVFFFCFCLSFKCFFNWCDFLEYFLFLAGGCLFGRQSLSGALRLAHPTYPQSTHKPSAGCISSRIPYGFSMAKPPCLVRRQKG